VIQLLASVESHLTDYELVGRYFTAHHFLLIMSAAVTIGLFAFAAKAIRTAPKGTGMVALLEVSLVWVRDEIVYPWLGEEQGRKYLFFFWTLFFFILVNNVIGLLPAPLNLWHRGATGNIAVTLSLAIVSFIVVNVIGGMREHHGFFGYMKALIPGGVPGFLVPIVLPIEIVGLFTKPFALTVRLFANMTAGHAILAVLFSFMWGIQHYSSAAIGASVSVAAFGFMLFIFLFETLVALIQAYIFTVLTAIFLSMAVSHDH
jgi:F-type H+-transporting ATPase subunit a